ncbi:NAD-dependent epimerase/dehydratase family protein [Pendulispora brunnea]|uniref:NAD-dependent epimerase/dehydratase family protein n=1 Tax=Pendulispora brunnea TaxID=2905690 RepID=A0ABZ2KQE3_9BACT
MKDTVLVTGGSGYVAGHCIVELLRQKYRVRTTVRSTSKEQAVRAAVARVVDPAGDLEFAQADLGADAGWDEAMAGCSYVLHVASPLGNDGAKDPEALMLPAREGTLRVLRAAAKAKVKRVVMTSSTAACTPPSLETAGDETIWTGAAHPTLNAYRRSKIAAERAAWDFMGTRDAGTTTLTTILPGAIFGPVLSIANLGSVQFIERLLGGKLPGVPGLGFCVVDVRDLASLHVRAMLAAEAAGQRFIAAGDFMWMDDIATTLRAELGAQASKVPTRKLPNIVLRALAWFSPPLRALTPLLGRRQLFNSAKAQRILGFSPRPATSTVVDCARNLLDHEEAAR